DLGTTKSCAAVFQRGHADIIVDEQHNRATPSYVSFTDAERLIGDAALYQPASNLANTVFDAKRLIGRRFDDKTVQEDVKRWPFKVVDNGNNTPMVEVEYKSETKRFRPEEISAMMLEKVKETAETFLGQPVTEAVISVPACFTDVQRTT